MRFRPVHSNHAYTGYRRHSQQFSITPSVLAKTVCQPRQIPLARYSRPLVRKAGPLPQ
jgi:hypothetical protein